MHLMGASGSPGFTRAMTLTPSNEEHRRSTMVATTPWMESFVADCLHRLPPPVDPNERDLIYDTCFTLFTAVETLETGTPQGGIGHYSTQTGTAPP
jgi:hypothetical protein